MDMLLVFDRIQHYQQLFQTNDQNKGCVSEYIFICYTCAPLKMTQPNKLLSLNGIQFAIRLLIAGYVVPSPIPIKILKIINAVPPPKGIKKK